MGGKMSRGRGWNGWGAVASVVLTSTGCLRIDDEHCMFGGGDARCSSRACVAVLEGHELRSADSAGCVDVEGEVPEAYVRVPYGLLLAVTDDEGVDSSESRPRTVEDSLRRLGVDVEQCDIGGEEVRAAVEGTAAIWRRLERLGVRKAEAYLSEDEVRAVEELNRVVDALLETCGGGAGTSSGTTGGAETTAGEGTSSTTTAGPCTDDEECLMMDPARPICGDDGLCVGCNGAGGDAACVEAHPDLPGCLIEGSNIGTCVQCTETATAACMGMTPICNPQTDACEPCVLHAQCMEAMGSACHIETGECLPADRVWHVDGDAAAGGDGSPGAPYRTIAAALMNVGTGEQGTIVLHEASSDYAATVSIDGGRVVAIVAPGMDRPRIATPAASGLVVASGSSTVVHLEGITIWADWSGPGLRADLARVYVDRCEIINNDTGIELTNGAYLFIRNSIVWTNFSDRVALSVGNAAVADIRYSMLAQTGGGFGTFDAVQCTNPTAVTVRNSVIVSRDDGANGWSCPEGTVSNSAGENIPPDNGNLLLCDSAVDCAMDIIPQLFVSASNLRLSASGAGILVDIPEPTASDPPYDIDLNPRPSLSGTDYAGAHAPP